MVDQSVQPWHMSTWRFPFAVKDLLEKELERLEGLEVIEATSEPSEWMSALAVTHNSGRLTSGSRPGQAVPSPFCQRSKDEGKLRPKFTKCEKINIFEHAAGFRPPVAMAKPKWRQILLNLTLFSNVTSKEGKPMSCACSVFIPVKRMGVCNFSPMG